VYADEHPTRWFHPDRPGLVAPVRVDPNGVDGPSPRQARSKRWRRTSRGFYVPSSVGQSVEQRIVEAAAPLPTGGGVTGWAALRWCGATWFDGLTPSGKEELPVVLASCYGDIRAQDGFMVCQERLSRCDVTTVDGLPVTIPARSVCFEMRYARTLRDAVVAFDMAAFADLVTTEEQWAYILDHPGWTGIPQARDVMTLVDENSWSPWETRLRVVWILVAGLPAPLCNRPLFDHDGRHIGTPDIFDPDAGVVGEYDGAAHLNSAQRAKDLSREAVFRRHGLEYFAVVGADMSSHATVAERMADAHRRGRSRRTTRPSWTLTPPSWWTESHTVEQRRALTGRARAAVLRQRRRLSGPPPDSP
jgi:hypothetical protein